MPICPISQPGHSLSPSGQGDPVKTLYADIPSFSPRLQHLSPQKQGNSVNCKTAWNFLQSKFSYDSSIPCPHALRERVVARVHGYMLCSHWYRVQALVSLQKLKKISQKDQMTDPHVSKLFLLPAVKQLCLDAKLGENYIGFGQDIAL